MTIFQRFWRQILSIFRRGGSSDKADSEDSPSSPAPGTPAEAPASPPAAPETVYMDVGMSYTLEGAQGKERPRVEVWPLQPSETRVAIWTAGRVIAKAVTIYGAERKQNPITYATFGSLLISALPDTVSIVVDNSRVGTLTFNSVQPSKFATFHQKVALK